MVDFEGPEPKISPWGTPDRIAGGPGETAPAHVDMVRRHGVGRRSLGGSLVKAGGHLVAGDTVGTDDTGIVHGGVAVIVILPRIAGPVFPGTEAGAGQVSPGQAVGRPLDV